tara:strand:- start:640 stop:828 length:189 start_codon:yes stop_codon:yes gene_type:complete
MAKYHDKFILDFNTVLCLVDKGLGNPQSEKVSEDFATAETSAVIRLNWFVHITSLLKVGDRH